MAEFIAFYLPQYHPIDENDKWYGKGFTEWTNVTKAKPLYRGHYQPHVPADLGFYDLRLPQARQAQATMAKDYGVSAFCYWNYWFGDKKQILESVIWEVYKDKTITFPFCLAWANHSWEKKLWSNKEKNELLVEQKYLGADDYTEYFYTMLPLFKDDRYYRVDGKLFFAVYSPMATPEMSHFISVWRELAKKEKLDGFYFVGHDADCRNKDAIMKIDFDAIYDDNMLNIHHKMSFAKKAFLYTMRHTFHKPTIINYKKAIKYMITENSKRQDVIPVIVPNWDHSPRSGVKEIMFKNCKPKYFKELVKMAISAVEEKNKEHQIVMIKSWNEWGEGNHMEPDLKYGLGYLKALREAIDEQETL